MSIAMGKEEEEEKHKLGIEEGVVSMGSDAPL
jgi:hypothetical protein